MMDDKHTSSEVTVLYSKHFGSLVAVGIEAFGMDERTANMLAHDVCLSAIRRLEELGDVPTWLLAAMVSASRTYVARSAGHPDTYDYGDDRAVPDVTMVLRLLFEVRKLRHGLLLLKQASVLTSGELTYFEGELTAMERRAVRLLAAAREHRH